MGKPHYAHTNLGIAMVQRKVSVADLSYETRISPRAIGYYLKGEKVLLPAHLRAISIALNVDPRDIFQPWPILSSLIPHQDHQAAARADLFLRNNPLVQDANKVT
jgi:transcriptional regulator with XRE-family HTH domain